MAAPQIKITFLGTGTSTGVPMIGCSCEVCTSSDPKDKRLRSSIMVESASTRIIVDTTPDFRYQMLREKVDRIDAVIFTHPHKDHVAGLDDIKAFNYFQKQAINVYANELTQEALRREFYYIFADNKYPGVPDVLLNDIPDHEFMIGDIPVLAVKAWHLKMPVLGFRFGDFTYITDANRIEAEEKAKIIDSKFLVLNALRQQQHISHFSLGEAIELAQEVHAANALFTHISHQMGLHEVISGILPAGMQLAYDGLTIDC